MILILSIMCIFMMMLMMIIVLTGVVVIMAVGVTLVPIYLSSLRMLPTELLTQLAYAQFDSL